MCDVCVFFNFIFWYIPFLIFFLPFLMCFVLGMLPFFFWVYWFFFWFFFLILFEFFDFVDLGRLWWGSFFLNFFFHQFVWWSLRFTFLLIFLFFVVKPDEKHSRGEWTRNQDSDGFQNLFFFDLFLVPIDHTLTFFLRKKKDFLWYEK